jgi:hypothetical protein
MRGLIFVRRIVNIGLSISRATKFFLLPSAICYYSIIHHYKIHIPLPLAEHPNEDEYSLSQPKLTPTQLEALKIYTHEKERTHYRGFW